MTGAFWMYLCKERPPAPGSIPRAGLIEVSDERMWCDGKLCWGWVQYNRELSENEIKDYELIYVWNSKLTEQIIEASEEDDD